MSVNSRISRVNWVVNCTVAFTAMLLLAACNPLSFVSTGAGMAVGAVDSVNKREQWEAYANKGDVYSQYELARSYCCGSLQGGHDPVKAIHWFCTSARNGYAKSQVEIGMLFDGSSELKYPVKQDLVNAYSWYRLAARRVNPQAMQKRKELEAFLKPSERQLSDVLIRDKSKMPCPVLEGADASTPIPDADQKPETGKGFLGIF